MKVLVTGAEGFVAQNLISQLAALKHIEVLTFTRKNQNYELFEIIKEVDFVFHLAGVNRPQTVDEFKIGNRDFTHALCEAIAVSNRPIPVLFTSSTQAALSNPYGESKKHSEEVLEAFSQNYHSPVFIYRLPNVFGKWTKPNYNSVVATFCYNIARDIPIQIHDPDIAMNLVYIDDVITDFISKLEHKTAQGLHLCEVEPVYNITIGELAAQIRAFSESRNSLTTEAVGSGLVRALYATYVSYLPTHVFSYEVPMYSDPRGVFVEMLKTKDSGQFSYFTAPPGITRGGHYHHSKTEKFLVIKGKARFRFRQIASQEYYELCTSGDKPEIVETVPGWTHDITNIGSEEMIVMLWANEIFDRAQPDTYACEL